MKNKLTWNDVTLKQFKELQELLKIEDESLRMFEIASLLLGEDVMNLSISDFIKETKRLEFIKEPVRNIIPPKKIKVNDREYYTDCLLGNITTGQYIDFQNHLKGGDIAKVLSVFVIPKGHKYNDGYDMNEVFRDINDLPIIIVNSLSFFFKRQFQESIRIFQKYSLKQLKTVELPQKKEITELVNKMMDGLVNLV